MTGMKMLLAAPLPLLLATAAPQADAYRAATEFVAALGAAGPAGTPRGIPIVRGGREATPLDPAAYRQGRTGCTANSLTKITGREAILVNWDCPRTRPGPKDTLEIEGGRVVRVVADTPVIIPIPVGAPRSDPRPINPGSLIGNADYPSEALRANEEGTVTFRLAVDAEGRATDCTILTSSRSATLDSATCRLMVRRSRFEPARGEDGKPVASSFVSRIRWALPKVTVPTPGLIATIVDISPTGAILSCRAVARGMVPESTTANACKEAASPGLSGMLAGAASANRRINLVRTVSEGAQSFPLVPSDWGTVLSRRSVDLAYSAGGALVSCEPRLSVGLGPDLCRQFGSPPTGAAQPPTRRITVDVAVLGTPR